MDLYIIRHGTAGPKKGGSSHDAERRLTGEGRGEVKDLARFLQSTEDRFDLIATSPYPRARETAEIVAGVLNHADQIAVWDELAPGGDIPAVCGRLRECIPFRRIIIVGHEPLMSALVSHIISGSDASRIAMVKGGCAKVRNITAVLAVTGELHWLVTPGMVRRSGK
jgi:phosphohistidine phosphatase